MEKIKRQKYLLVKLMLAFAVMGVLGTYWEVLYIFVLKGQWTSRQGVLYGPFNAVYALGGALCFWAFSRRKYRLWQMVLLGAVISGATEYVVHFLHEKILRSVAWDYRGYPLNIDGRTNLLYMIFFGVAVTACYFLIYRNIEKAVNRLSKRKGLRIAAATAAVLIFAFLLVDIALTDAVLLRQAARHRGIPPATAATEWINKKYDDNYLNDIFPYRRSIKTPQ